MWSDKKYGKCKDFSFRSRIHTWCTLPMRVCHLQDHLENAAQQIMLPKLKERWSKPCASGHEGNWVEILLSPLPQVLIWKAEFSNFLFLFAAIERATLDVDAQQLEVMWLMMLQLDKGGNGKNPADFSECWIKHLLNNLNSSKIPLFTFFLFPPTYYCYCGSLFVFAKAKNIIFLFEPFFFKNFG